MPEALKRGSEHRNRLEMVTEKSKKPEPSKIRSDFKALFESFRRPEGEKKISVREMAERMDTHETTIERYLNAERDVTVEKMQRWLKLMGARLELVIDKKKARKKSPGKE